MNKTSLSKLAVPLLDFGSSLKISRDQWIQREELKKITYSCPNLDRESAIGLTLEQIISLANIYGEALSCRFRLGDLTVLDITSTVNEENLNNFRNQTLGSPTLDFTLRLDKGFLIQHLKENDFEGYNIFLYFFPESLEKFLKLELDQLEKQLWGDKVAHKIILLVPDHEIKLQGSYMSVLGGKYAENWQEYLSQEAFNAEQLKSMYQNCQRFLRWQEVQISHLTPLHFQLSGYIPTEDSIARTLWSHLAKLIVLYTADRTVVRTTGEWVATYAGARQTVDLVLSDLSELSAEELRQGTETLLQSIEWIYNPQRVDDCLLLFQIGAIQALQIADSRDRYQLLIRKASYISDELRWHWKAFAESKVDGYTEQVRALEDYVAITVQAFSEQVSGMTKNLSDTVLAAIGALLGSFIAALFSDKFNPDIFRIGLWTYAGYVFLFPLIYTTIYQQWQRYQILIKNFSSRRLRFEQRLYSQKVEEIIEAQIDTSKRQFIQSFWITISIYFVVIILAILASIFLPKIMNISSPKTLPSTKQTPQNSPKPANTHLQIPKKQQ